MVLFDEKLTSASAELALEEATGQFSARRDGIDSVAAAMLLQGYFQQAGRGALAVLPTRGS